MKSLKENLPKNQGEFYVKFNKENQPEYGFLVDGTVIVKYVNFDNNDHRIIYLPDLSDRVQPINLDESQYDVNEVVEATLIHRNHDYLRGQVKLGKDCFKGVTNVTIIKTTNELLAISPECFSPDANISFIAPENFKLASVIKQLEFQPKQIFPIIIDGNSLCQVSGHVNFPSKDIWAVRDFKQDEYDKHFPQISINQDTFVKDDKLESVKNMESEREM